jgi:hypothetical protein
VSEQGVPPTEREQPQVPPTEREQASVPPTAREGEAAATEAVRARINLPPELEGRYETIRDLASGGESDVLLVRRRADGERVVLKLYRLGFEPDEAVLARVRDLPPRHVVQIFDYGRSQFGWWEELEWVEHGSLADLLEREGPRLSSGRLRQVIDELVNALEATKTVFHRDIKPSNVLARSLEPLDLVLGDFGLARVSSEGHSHLQSTRAGTAAYQSPQALEGDVSAARDWWAVGMVVAEAAIGYHPLYEPGLPRPLDYELKIAIQSRPIPLDGIQDERVRLLCRGLLARDPHLRWGAAEVRAWQAGESPPVAVETAPARHRVPPFVFAGQRCTTPAVLVPVLAEHWNEAVDLIEGAESEAPMSVRLVVWLQDHGEASAVRIVERGAKDRSFIRRLFRLLRTLAPELPPTFEGSVIDRPGLLALARNAAGGDANAAAVVNDLQRLGILGELAREERYADLLDVEVRWKAQVELLWRLRDELGAIANPLDREDVARAAHARILVALLDDAELRQLGDRVAESVADPDLLGIEAFRGLLEAVLATP